MRRVPQPPPPERDVVVGITSIPSRVNKCESVVRSIVDKQIVRPSRLIVTLPRTYTRFPDQTLTVPEFMTRHPRVDVLRVERDYGPATKIMGVLLYADVPSETVVAITDDDGIKTMQWLETLVREVKHAPDSVATLGTHPADEVYGGRGFAFRRGIFEAEDMLNALDARPECRLIDDDFLTHYCRTRGIPIVKVNPKGLFVAETPDFRDKLRELRGGAFFPKGEEARKNLRGKCADTFGQPSLYRECGSSGRRCTG